MDKRKGEIVEVALKRFAHYGFNKTTMNEIADDLKITKANLYYYYPDKMSLIKDVVFSLAEELSVKEETIINNYDSNLLDILYELLDLKATFIRKYYVLHINESLEWIKGLAIEDLIETFFKRDVLTAKSLFQKAMDAEEIVFEDVEEASLSFVEITKGLGVLCNMEDIISGLPNSSNVDKILESQRRATKFIFEGKISK